MNILHRPFYGTQHGAISVVSQQPSRSSDVHSRGGSNVDSSENNGERDENDNELEFEENQALLKNYIVKRFG